MARVLRVLLTVGMVGFFLLFVSGCENKEEGTDTSSETFVIKGIKRLSKLDMESEGLSGPGLMALKDDYLYATTSVRHTSYSGTSYDYFLLAIDIKDRSNPAIVTTISSDRVSEMVIHGDFLYVSCADGTLKKYDLSSPLSPSLVSSRNISPQTTEDFYVGNYGYFHHDMDGSVGLRIVDIDSDTLDDVSTLSLTVASPSAGIGVTVSGYYAAMYGRSAGKGYVSIAAIGDAKKPTEQKTITFPKIVDNVQVDGNYTYVSTLKALGALSDDPINDQDYDVLIYNSTNPIDPQLVKGFDVSNDVNNMAISGNYLFVTTWHMLSYLTYQAATPKNLVEIYDISDRTAPSRIIQFDMGSNAYDMILDEQYIYLSHGWGIEILETIRESIIEGDPIEGNSTDDPDLSFYETILEDLLFPNADAGDDQTVAVGSSVTLEGNASTSPTGAALDYLWTMSSKPDNSQAALSGATTHQASFTPDINGTYVITLKVDDGNTSSEDNVTITALTGNLPPTANAGADQSVTTGAVVTLDGSGSSDSDGGTLSYFWTLTPATGSSATLSSEEAESPTFTADAAGTYTAELIVNDGDDNSTADSVTITVTDVNQAPTANAGPDQNVSTGSPVTLDGSASSDPESATLSYTWTLTPATGSSITTTTLTGVNPTFTPDIDGTYTVSLVVSDGIDSSSADSVTVTATTPGVSATVAGSVTLSSNEGKGNDLFMDGNYAYLATEAGLTIIDISTPSSSSVAGNFSAPADCYVSDVAVDGDRAYIVDTNQSNSSASRLIVLDITDKTNPTSLGSIATPGIAATAVRADGDYAYVLDGSGFTVYNVATPASIVQGGTATFANNDPYKMEINGTHAFVATNSGLNIVDINGTSPGVVGDTGNMDWFINTDVTYSNGYAYLAAETDGLKVYDVSDPTSPALVATVTPTDYYSVYSVSVSGNTLSAAYSTNSSTEEVAVYDISNPASPQEETTVTISTTANGIASSGSLVGVAANDFVTYKAFELIEITGQ